MESIINEVFSEKNIIFYCLGFGTFIISLLDDIIQAFSKDKRKGLKPWSYYVQEVLYTIISILLGVSICYIMEINTGLLYLISITMGLVGSNIIRKIKANSDKISDTVSDKIIDVISDKGTSNDAQAI